MTVNGVMAVVLRYFTELVYDIVVKQLSRFQNLLFTARRNARIASHCKRCISYSNSVCPSIRLSVCLFIHPSVTCRYCVKMTACSTVQFAQSDSKMCLVLHKPKNIPQGRPLPPEILAPSDLPTPEGSEF